MSFNIPNRIKQPGQCCVHCGKSYNKKSNLNNHVIICELLHSNSKSLDDEDEPLPSQRKMYQMIIEISKKLNDLDQKMEEANKWIVKKKKKINIIEWLNLNVIPDFTFEQFINKINILDDDINILFDNTFVDVLNQVFSRNFCNNETTENLKCLPILAFIQKQNIFYIYKNKETGWSELDKENLILFLNNVFIKISRVFSDWKKINKDKLEEDEKFQLLCDKTSLKMYSVDFKQDSTLSKIKTTMYNKIKKDTKGLVEYEFEF
jgi:hypothetical protein